MSQRNFPPSFWNSNYQPPSISSAASSLTQQHYDFPGFSTDPYSHMTSSMTSLHAMTSLQDPWRYPTALASSQAHSAYAPHVHDFASSYSATARFNPAAAHYSSLLPAATRLGGMSSMSSMPTMGQCEAFSKHTGVDHPAWGSRYHHHSTATDLSHHTAASLNAAATGLGGKYVFQTPIVHFSYFVTNTTPSFKAML